MNVTGTYKGLTYKEVIIGNIPEDREVSDDLLVGFAMRAMGEDPSSLFGWGVTRWPQTTTATVTLNTD